MRNGTIGEQATMPHRSPVPSKEHSAIAGTWRRFRQHKLGVAGSIVFGLLSLLCFAVPLVSPWDPTRIEYDLLFSPPSLYHLLGTDELGRDLFTRLFYAGRISLSIGVLCSLSVLLIGATVGAAAGFVGGWIDSILMRLVDLLLVIPLFPLLLVLSNSLGRSIPSFWAVVLVLIAFGWLRTSRIVRAQILTLRELPFIEAARALGASPRRIVLRHMLPNSIAPLVVNATLNMGTFMIAEASLSYLSFGVRPPTPTWGNMLTDVDNYFLVHPLLGLYPGLAIFLTVVSVNFMGDALLDALDPRA